MSRGSGVKPPAARPHRSPFAVYSFVMSVNSFVMGWTTFSRLLHIPCQTADGVSYRAGEIHPPRPIACWGDGESGGSGAGGPLSMRVRDRSREWELP